MHDPGVQGAGGDGDVEAGAPLGVGPGVGGTGVAIVDGGTAGTACMYVLPSTADV